MLDRTQGRVLIFSAPRPASSEQFNENPLSTQTTQLTTQINPEEIFEEIVTFSRKNDDPFPDKTPSTLLTREYLILDDTLENDEYHAIYPHGLLLIKDTIKKYLSRFALFRADLKLRFEIISSPMQYGNIFVSMLPYQKGASDWLSVTQQSQASLHNLDIGLQQGLDITLPYLSPKLYWELKNLTDSPAWRVTIRCDTINALTSNAPLNVRLKVYASFVNPEAAGYTQAVLQSRTMDRRSMFQIPTTVASGLGAAGQLARNRVNDLMGTVTSNPAAAAAGVSAAAAGMKAASVAADAVKNFKRVETPSSNMKLDLCCDLSAPSANNTTALLGDPILRDYTHLPPDRAGDLGSILSTPTLVYQDTLTFDTPKMLEVDPFELGTYSHYLSKMFKHYRGSQQLLFRFITAPSVSTRVQLTLYPTLDPAAGEVDTEGDLPTKILSLRGTTSVTIDVPYLSTKPWTSVFQPYKPVIKITMLDPMIQQYDKAPVLYMDVYQRCADDFMFSGLQSFVPQNAVLQSWVADEFAPYSYSDTHRYPYQGCQSTVDSILMRFSSRDPEPQLLFPFPVKIQDWTSAWKLDNFDYLANLFAFYTGDTRVKMLFSKGAASGLLRVSVGNSNTHTGPKQTTWKSSNSMILTDQTVWPVLEYEYPYQNEYEYDSIWYPNSMFPQKVDQTAELDSFFLAASEEFSLYYLLPIPSFALVEPDPAAILQSSFPMVPRLVGAGRVSGQVVLTSAAQSKFLELHPSFPFGSSYYLGVDVSVVRDSGSQDGVVNFAVGKNASITPINVQGSVALPLVGGTVVWKDTANNGKSVAKGSSQGSFASLGVPEPLTFMAATNNLNANTFTVYFTAWWAPWESSVFLSSPQNTSNTLGVVALDGTTSLPVSIQSSEVTLDTTVVNMPLPVTVVNTPSVTVSNMLSEPVDVNVQGTIPITGSVTVQGMIDPDQPVWVTAYKP